jgi:hypothetical protein
MELDTLFLVGAPTGTVRVGEVFAAHIYPLQGSGISGGGGGMCGLDDETLTNLTDLKAFKHI